MSHGNASQLLCCTVKFDFKCNFHVRYDIFIRYLDRYEEKFILDHCSKILSLLCFKFTWNSYVPTYCKWILCFNFIVITCIYKQVKRTSPTSILYGFHIACIFVKRPWEKTKTPSMIWLATFCRELSLHDSNNSIHSI